MSLILSSVLLENKLRENILRIKILGTIQYRYFNNKSANFYTFEKKISSFFNSIDKNFEKGIEKQLLKLKEDILKIEERDTYGFINKVNQNFFNFYGWLDDCIQLVQ